MDIRELVKLKKGTGGLGPPMNLGIILDRGKEGKKRLAKVFTLAGSFTIRWKNIGSSTGLTYQGKKDDIEAMKVFIRTGIEKERKKDILKLKPSNIIDSLEPERIWRSVIRYLKEGDDQYSGISEVNRPRGVLPVLLSPSDIGHIYYLPKYLDPKQVWAVSKVLSNCNGPGEPYFIRIDREGKPYYMPYSTEALRDMKEDIQGFKELSSRFVEWVPSEEIGASGSRKSRKVPKLISEDLNSIEKNLGTDQGQRLTLVLSWATAYLENGKWPDDNIKLEHSNIDKAQPFGLALFPVRRLGKFDLEKFIELLSMDLSGSRKGRLASSLLTMLLKFKRIDWFEASELVVAYKLSSGSRRFKGRFPKHIKKVSRSLSSTVEEKDKIGRTDLTHLETYTIDPTDAKDFDDAVSLQNEGEKTIIWVHIADVSHYVRPGDLIDGEARYRGTSVYLPTGVLPMLPPELSENICSLKEKEIRLALSTRMTFDKRSGIIEWEHVPSFIKVDGNLSYDKVEEFISEGKEPFKSLYGIAESLSVLKKRLDLSTPERKVRFSGPEKLEVSLKRPSRATRMIEELMIATNECAASTMIELGIPTAFRSHPLPDVPSAKAFNEACETMEIPVRIETGWGKGEERGEEKREKGEAGYILSELMKGGKISLGALSGVPDEDMNKNEDEGDEEGQKEGRSMELKPLEPDVMNRAVDSYNDALKRISSTVGPKMRDLLNMALLRTLPRALYTVDPIGHFGLRSLNYCHFTSPIRRYPDILVHRAIKAHLSEKGGGYEVGWETPQKDELEMITRSVNEMTDEAVEWEREMVDVALATRMEMNDDLKKGAHKGLVTSITPSSCYIQLEDGVTEGKIPIRYISPHRPTTDENCTRVMIELTTELAEDKKMRGLFLKGEEEITLLKLGQTIECTLHSTAIADGEIELSISRALLPKNG